MTAMMQPKDNNVSFANGIAMDDNLDIISNLHKARRWLYVSHVASQLSSGVYGFVIYLFLAFVAGNKSILWVSTYYLATYMTLMLFSTLLGRWLDGQQLLGNRLTAAKICITGEQGSVLVTIVACCWLLTIVEKASSDASDDSDDQLDSVSKTVRGFSAVLLLCIHIFGSLAQLLSQGLTMAMERDWIVVLSQQHQQQNQRDQTEETHQPTNAERFLSQTNVVFRQIHLICKILSPAMVGLTYVATAGHGHVGNVHNDDNSSNNNATTTMSSLEDSSSPLQEQGDMRFCHLHGAAVLVAMLALMSWMMERFALSQVCWLVPVLNKPRQSQHAEQQTTTAQDIGTDIVHEREENAAIGAGTASNQGNRKRQQGMTYMEINTNTESNDNAGSNNFTTKYNSNFLHSCAVYWQQQVVVWAGISLAFVNANALCFGGAMDTYLLWKGMPVEQVGFWRSLASAVGLLGTVCYNLSTQGCHVSVVHTGAWSIVYLFTCLTVACAGFFIGSNVMDNNDGTFPSSMHLLVVGTAAGRIGLWVFDISVTMLYQETVPDGVRILTGGTQQSLNSFFTMASGALGLVFRKPEQFVVIALAGYGCIGIAMVMYTLCVVRRGQYFASKSMI